MPTPSPILIRADASVEIGTGHVMRCLAIAQATIDQGGAVHWVAASLPGAIRERLDREKITSHAMPHAIAGGEDAGYTAALATTVGAESAVLDGYGFRFDYQSALKAAGLNVLVLDDDGETGPWNCDAILNQNLHAREIDYSNRPAGCRLLLGTSFCLLRRELRKALEHHAPADDRDQEIRLLLMMGGSDPANVTGQMLSELSRLATDKKVLLRVILGGANPHRHEVENQLPCVPFPAELVVGAEDMSEHYKWANAAITAAGSSCWELLAFKVPFVAVSIAKNQNHIARAFEDPADAGRSVADRLNCLFDPAPVERAGMVVDGRGVDRVRALWRNSLCIQIGVSEGSWMEPHISELVAALKREGHQVWAFSKVHQIKRADITFLLSFQDLVKKRYRDLSSHTLVLHGSDLPKGRGWSPWVWTIIEGADRLVMTLFEAEASVDSGVIYLQSSIELAGHELIDEIRDKIGKTTIEMCLGFVSDYPSIVSGARPQSGEPSYYGKRSREDSALDPDRTLTEQFNLLRVVDNDRYPAFFDLRGCRYHIKISKA